MKKSILVCCADTRTNTLDAAVYFAKMFDTSITLLYALEPLCDLLPDFSASVSPAVQQSLLARIEEEGELDKRLESKEAEQILNECAKYCENAGVSAQTLHLVGDLEECVSNIERDYYLLIAEVAHEDNSHVYDILRVVNIPIMLCAQEFSPIGSVLFAYDGKDQLKDALRRTLQQPLFAKCRRTCLHMSKDEDKAQQVLNDAKALFGEFGIEIECAHTSELNAEGLIKYADENAYDVICMGAYSSNAFKRFLIGSFTNEMIEKSKKSLFIFK